MTPQIILLCIALINIVVSAIKHGEPKDKTSSTYNFWITLGNILVLLGLLYWGGFFQVFSN